MIIGLDFDNCIISYDDVFFDTAVRFGLIDPDTTIPGTKQAVRAELRRRDLEDKWTEMQGYVYGVAIEGAMAYPDAIKTIAHLTRSHDVHIISHKTQFPFLGEKYDLHEAARMWIDKNLRHADGDALFAENNIHFNQTKEEKVGKIATVGCDVFIDDLPEILLHGDFPEKIRRFLFQPNPMQQDNHPRYTVVHHWNEFRESLT
jgi:hypothetical protein